MKRALELAACLWLTAASLAYANVQEIEHWLEMAELCETLITDQNLTSFKGFEAAAPLVEVDGLNEISVHHHTSPLIASAVSDTNHWFLCLVAANPPIKARDAGELIEAWSVAQHHLTRNSTSASVVFDDGRTLAPVRVECKAEGRIVVILGFISDHGDFRIGVTNRLPDSVELPC